MSVFDLIVTAFFSLGATVLLVTGMYALRRTWRLLAAGTRVPGTIIGWVKVGSSSDEHGPAWHPKVRFTLPSGVMREFTSEASGSPKRWPVGTDVTVCVIGEGPRDAELLRPAMLVAGPLVMMLLGGAALWLVLDVLSG